MSLILTFMGVRTNIRGKPNQQNSMLPPCEMVERGSKVGTVKMCSEGSVPILCPHFGERGQGRTLLSPFPFSTPGYAPVAPRKRSPILDTVSQDYKLNPSIHISPVLHTITTLLTLQTSGKNKHCKPTHPLFQATSAWPSTGPIGTTP